MEDYDYYSILALIIVLISIVVVGCVATRDKQEEAERNYCIRTLVEEDYVAKDCDKYFLKENWYQDYMNNIEREYEKIERESEE